MHKWTVSALVHENLYLLYLLWTAVSNRPQMKCHPIFHATPRQLILHSDQVIRALLHNSLHMLLWILHRIPATTTDMKLISVVSHYFFFFFYVKKSFNPHSVMLVVLVCCPVMGICWLSSLDTGISHQQLWTRCWKLQDLWESSEHTLNSHVHFHLWSERRSDVLFLHSKTSILILN